MKGETALQLDFSEKAGSQYNFDIKYKKLPANHAFPNNLHITLSKVVVKNWAIFFWVLWATNLKHLVPIRGNIFAATKRVSGSQKAATEINNDVNERGYFFCLSGGARGRRAKTCR